MGEGGGVGERGVCITVYVGVRVGGEVDRSIACKQQSESWYWIIVLEVILTCSPCSTLIVWTRNVKLTELAINHIS